MERVIYDEERVIYDDDPNLTDIINDPSRNNIIKIIPRLLYLDIRNRQIKTLKGVNFSDSPYLDLSNNQITTLEGVTFSDSLQELYLGNNRITTLEGVAFS